MTTRRELLQRSVPLALTGGAFASLMSANVHAIAQDGIGQGRGNGEGKLQKVLSNVWDGQSYTLPDLPYDYNALEPHIDEQTMTLHHDKHHQAYVDGLNKAVKALEEAAGDEDVDGAKLHGLQRDLSFNYGGHLLHSLFWATMGPGSDGGEMGGEPVGELKKAIDQAYGSFGNFKSHFAATGGTVKGSGWVMLTFDPVADHVFVKAINEHDSYFGPGQLPIVPLDIWEHAFYLKYQNNKAAYIEAWFNTVDWRAADHIYRLYHQLWVGKSEHTEEHGHD